MSRTIIVATRASKLAVAQTTQTVEKLRELNPEYSFKIKEYTTKGDKDRTTPITQFGGTGIFVKELEQALINKEADIAIHSLKDVPNSVPNGLALIGFPIRERVEDVLLTNGNKSLAELKENPVIGTGSLRRRIQIKALRPDAQFTELRGNIDTRIRKIQEGEYDGIVLAAAGLKRLGIDFDENQVLKTNEVIPAIGQGCLALEVRDDDKEIHKIINSINHEESKNSVLVERAIMKEIEGGCKFPLAAYAKQNGTKISYSLLAGDIDTGKYIKLEKESSVESSIEEAIQMAKELKQKCEEENINLKYE